MNEILLAIKLFQNAAFRRRFFLGTDPSDDEYGQWLLLMGVDPKFIHKGDKYYSDYPNPTNNGICKISYPRKPQTQKGDGVKNINKQIHPSGRFAITTASPRLLPDNAKVPNYQRDDDSKYDNKYETKPIIVIDKTKNGSLVKNNSKYPCCGSHHHSKKYDYNSHVGRIIEWLSKGNQQKANRTN